LFALNPNPSSLGVELDVILTAEDPIPYGYVYRAGGSRLNRLIAGLRPGGKVLNTPCLAFVVRHPSAGTILIDTGLHPDARGNLRRDFGLPMSVLFRRLRPAGKPFDEQLRTLGIEPVSVERVIMTHLHVDHTSGMRLLPNAEFICSRDEWSATRSRLAAGSGYVRHHLPPASRMRFVDFDSAGEPYKTFAKTIDLLGDGTIRLLSTPGHTVGHLSVLLQLAQEHSVLVIGDAAYTLRNIHEEILPMISADDNASVRSICEIKAFTKDEPNVIVVPTHDPNAWHELRNLTVAPP
jgi:N-acyl homoserine lactone hydrolase